MVTLGGLSHLKIARRLCSPLPCSGIVSLPPYGTPFDDPFLGLHRIARPFRYQAPSCKDPFLCPLMLDLLFPPVLPFFLTCSLSAIFAAFENEVLCLFVPAATFLPLVYAKPATSGSCQFVVDFRFFPLGRSFSRMVFSALLLHLMMISPWFLLPPPPIFHSPVPALLKNFLS